MSQSDVSLVHALPASIASQLGTGWPAAAIFDCDGLLLDTREAWHSAFMAARTTGKVPLDDATIAQLNGASVRSAARLLGADEGALRTLVERALAEARPRPMRGARELVSALSQRARLAVATNGPEGAVRGALKQAGLAERFEAIVSAEGLANEKPAPDVYLSACERLGVAPSDAVALEDSPVGAMAARAAGLLVVYVPSDPTLRADADLQVGSLEDAPLLSLFGLSGSASLARPIPHHIPRDDSDRSLP